MPMNVEDLLSRLTEMVHSQEGVDGLLVACCTTSGIDLGNVERMQVFESDYHPDGALYLEIVPSKVAEVVVPVPIRPGD